VHAPRAGARSPWPNAAVGMIAISLTVVKKRYTWLNPCADTAGPTQDGLDRGPHQGSGQGGENSVVR
jgi:hypothetical protein